MKRATPIALMVAGLLGTAPALASEQELRQEIDNLKQQNQTIMERLNATSEMLDSSQKGMGHHGGSGRTTIGGYGELHYNNLSNNTASGDDKKEIDFHRFILFLGHEFSNNIRFWSELEVEHAKVDSGGGEVAIEQAFVEFDLNDNLMARGGVLLVPVGIINETHEPPTFYGVERPIVENKIIPTTWREGGVSLAGRSGSISYDLAVHSGLETFSGSGTNYAVRSGRQGVREAPADNLAYTARVKWSGVAGLQLAAAVQRQTDVTQSTDPTAGAATLIEADATWQQGPFALRALYATWDLDGSGPASVGADEQTGWYVEPSYKLNPKWGVFARHSNWDNQAGSSADTEYSQTDVGFNYWPHEDVVLKFDYQIQDAPAGSDEYDGVNLGIGYQF